MKLNRWFAQINLALTAVLLGALFILVNFISSRRYARADLTRTKLTALSDKTTQVLSTVQTPITVVVFYQPSHPLYELIHDLLAEYQRLDPTLEIDYVDPAQDIARARQLAGQYEIERENVVVFDAGGSAKRHLSDTDLAEYDYLSMGPGGGPTLKAFTGEEAFTSAILGVTQTTQPLVWMVTGHGEKAIEDTEPAGLADFAKRLQRHNMKVAAVPLLDKSAIPKEVAAVIIAGPTHRFVDSELLALQAYLERGGRLLLLIDPLTDAGLDDLLAHWGVTLGQNIVVDPARQLPFVSAANLFVTTYTEHPVVKKMQTLMTLFPMSRSVTPAEGRTDLKATALALTSPQGWGETATDVKTFTFDNDKDLKGPVSIAVAVERESKPAKTRLIVIGDSDFIANGQVSNVGNGDFALGALEWLVDQERFIGIGPKRLEAIKLNLTDSQLSGIFWFSLAGLPCLMGLFGAGMWWRRRT